MLSEVVSESDALRERVFCCEMASEDVMLSPAARGLPTFGVPSESVVVSASLTDLVRDPDLVMESDEVKESVRALGCVACLLSESDVARESDIARV